MIFAAWSAELARPEKDGRSARVHLEFLAKEGRAEAIEQLIPPPFPEALQYLWNWWGELHAARRQSEYGLAALTYQDLDAWARLTGRDPEPFEVDLLLRLDAVMRSGLAH